MTREATLGKGKSCKISAQASKLKQGRKLASHNHGRTLRYLSGVAVPVTVAHPAEKRDVLERPLAGEGSLCLASWQDGSGK